MHKSAYAPLSGGNVLTVARPAAIAAWAGLLASIAALIVTVALGSGDDLHVASFLLPIPVLAGAVAVAVARHSLWAWLFLALELAFIAMAILSVGFLFLPGLLLGFLGCVLVVVGQRSDFRTRE